MSVEASRSRSERRVTYNLLLWCLLGVMLASPFADAFGMGDLVLGVGLSVVLIAAIKEEATTRRRLTSALLLGVPAVLARLVGAVWDHPPMSVEIAIFMATGSFLGYVIYHILRDVVLGGEVDQEKLNGAICVYLLMGMAWWVVYLFVELLQPGSFLIPSGTTGDVGGFSDELFYFSFVTLTTLGYGDIQPVTSFTRSFAIVEAIVGQLFLAVMIARLVGMQGSSRKPTA